MKKLALLFAILCGNAIAQTSTDKFAIEGTVVNSVTGEGIKKAQVIVQPADRRNAENLIAEADGAGHYAVDNLEPGRYIVIAERNGFVASHGRELGSVEFTLKAGDSRRDVDVRLTPQGVITGRVLDEDGDPMSSVTVEVFRSMYVRGRKQLIGSQGTAANDLGEFRVSGLAPGKYFLLATSHQMDRSRGAPAKGSEHEEAYPPTFYPNALQMESAIALNVTAGAQRRGIDITISKVRAVRVRGRVVDALNKPLPNAGVSMTPLNSTPKGATMRGSIQNSDGTFEFHDIPVGSYVLASNYVEEKVHMTGRQAIDVGNTNVDGVVVTVGPSPEIQGKIVMDGNSDFKPSKIDVYLTQKTNGEGVGSSAIAGGNGSFVLQYVLPEQYEVNVAGLPANAYVKSIKLGDTDATEGGLDFTQGVSAAQLTVVLSGAGGKVEGSVQDDNQKPVVGANVVLIPEAQKRGVLRLYRERVSDANGHYSMSGIAPGDYKLFAWEQIEGDAYEDPEFLKSFESRGETISIKEGSSENKALTVIPADQTKP
jgi:protocatechuate 3,4-dioxygenase beta subunit